MLKLNNNKLKENNLKRSFSFLFLVLYFFFFVLYSNAETKLNEKTISLFNIHTKEKLEIMFWKDGSYIKESLEKINFFLRDYRTGQSIKMDTKLLDLLFNLSNKLNTKEPFNIISGFRSTSSNEYLHNNTQGVAKKSLHMEGKALDISLSGVSLVILRNESVRMGYGGVGFYPESNFVHVDVENIRYW